MRILAPLLALAVAAPLQAQDLDPWRGGLPASAAARIDALLADHATLRLEGTHAIAATREIAGSVVVEGGVLSLAGTVRGQLVVLGGDLEFVPGARVLGDVLVVDGRVSGEEDATVGGSLTVYGPRDPWVPARRFHGDEGDWDRRRGLDRYGDFDLNVGVQGNYNRVEGLPLAFGPEIRTGGPVPLRIQAQAVWRTDAGSLTATDRMGYTARVEQFLPGRALRVGAALRSTVHPIEAWSMSDTEASLAAALLHQDPRDYFEREGWSAYARYAPERSPLDVVVEYRDEDHGALAARDPWTLFNGGDTWRLQPLVAEGNLRSLHGRVEVDATRGWDFGRRGLFAAVTLDHALDGVVRVPGGAPPPGSLGVMYAPTDFAADYTTALVDLRSFQRAGHGILAVRLVGGGGLERTPLPPQFQHALGGAGSLPGYAFFAADCGARSSVVSRADGADGALFHPAYGCDRFGMVQVEYRGGFDIRWEPGNDDGRRRRRRVDLDADWTVFFDAGRGGSYDGSGALAADTGTLYDVGAGIVLGDVGLYGAVPLTGEERDLRFFLRIGPRF